MAWGRNSESGAGVWGRSGNGGGSSVGGFRPGALKPAPAPLSHQRLSPVVPAWARPEDPLGLSTLGLLPASSLRAAQPKRQPAGPRTIPTHRPWSRPGSGPGSVAARPVRRSPPAQPFSGGEARAACTDLGAAQHAAAPPAGPAPRRARPAPRRAPSSSAPETPMRGGPGGEKRAEGVAEGMLTLEGQRAPRDRPVHQASGVPKPRSRPP